MPPSFITMTRDPFAAKFTDPNTNKDRSKPPRRATGWAAERATLASIRRPTRGIQIKEDTYAILSVETANGLSIPLIDSGGTQQNDRGGVGYSTKYSNFIVQAISEQRQEKSQVVLTFGEPYIFFYGEQPRIITVNGVLMNTEDFNWRAEFWENYDRYLRGTRCVENKTRVTLSWDTIVVQGYIMGAQASESADQPYHLQFSFQMFLTAYEDISSIGNPIFPVNEALANQAADIEFNNGASVRNPDANDTATLTDKIRSNLLSLNDELSFDAEKARKLAQLNARVPLPATSNITFTNGITGPNNRSGIPFPDIRDAQAILNAGGPLSTLVANDFNFKKTFGLEEAPSNPVYTPPYNTPTFGRISANFDEYMGVSLGQLEKLDLRPPTEEIPPRTLFDKACAAAGVDGKTKSILSQVGTGVFGANGITQVFNRTVSTAGVLTGDGSIVAKANPIISVS